MICSRYLKSLVLIVLAASRISMNVVNGKLQMQSAEKPNENNPYLARPPRRKLVIGSIVLCAGAEFFWANNVVTGWIAMATMASIFNLLNDWHIGRPLMQRYSIMLYLWLPVAILGLIAVGLLRSSAGLFYLLPLWC